MTSHASTQDGPVANFIIAGTEKAGTTSVFTYLSEHAEVCAATVKETDFFRREAGWDEPGVLREYQKFFSRCAADAPVIMEASPGYLGESTTVAPRIAQYLPDVRFLFILRNPVERFQSSYNFHVGRLNIPRSVTISEYLDKCFAFDSGRASAAELGMDEWFLKVLRFGRYADGLEDYYAAFPADNIQVMFFDELLDDTRSFMLKLSEFLGIEKTFWESYEFHRQNVTFASRFKAVHKLALGFNAIAEPVFRRQPALKRVLLKAYKAFNEDSDGPDSMGTEVRAALMDYYTPGNVALEKLIQSRLPDSWGAA